MAIMLLFARYFRALPIPSESRLGSCLRSSVASWSCDFSSFASSATPNKRTGSDGGDKYRERQEKFWQDLFYNPSEWWDNRLDKKGPLHPDFRHKKTREPLWLINQYKPLWVDFRLPTLGVQMQNGKKGDQGCSVVGYLQAELQGLCEEGQLDKALDVLSRMDKEGTVPSGNVYSCLLKACVKKKALTQAKLVQASLAKHGLEIGRFLGESLVSTLVKCGGLEDARQLFFRLPQRTVFSWTALISGCTIQGQGQEALRLYRYMREDGLEPDKYTFASLLKACGNIPDLEEGKRIHMEALKYGCETDTFLGTSLVDMYGKCGSIVDAQRVFDELLQRNVVSWTSMLSAYVQQGQADKVLHLYDTMQEEGVSPNDRTFVILFRACSMIADKEETVTLDKGWVKVKALKKAMAIHTDCKRRGYDSDAFVGSTLIHMYGKCGSIVDAQNVFEGLSKRNVVAWNAMVAAYTQQGQPEKGLQLYDQMQEEGINPDDRTFVSLLQACGILAEKDEGGDGKLSKAEILEKGKAIHVDALRKGYKADVFVGTTLVSMYGKCGSIVDAQNVFDGLSRRSVVAWTAILGAYVQQSQAEKALDLYEQMRAEGVSPNDRTFVSALQACSLLAEDGVIVDMQLSKQKSLAMGRKVHADAERKGCDLDVFVGSTLISMYGKCGSILDAEKVFHRLSQRNVVSWTAMLAAYTQQGQPEKAVELYEQMRSEGVSANDRTFVSVLQACGMLAEMEDVTLDGQTVKVKSLEMGKAIHVDTRRKGYDADTFVGSTLISMYGKCGSITEAQNVFQTLSQKSVVTWTAMIVAYTQQNQAEKALLLYDQMRVQGISPNDLTFLSGLQACGMLSEKEEDVVVDRQLTKVKCLGKVREIHIDACRKGYNSHLPIGNTLISMYGKCGSIADAQELFERLPVRDLVSWNVIVAAYAQQGQGNKALQLYRQMIEEGVTPNDITLIGMLQACSSTGNLDVCRQIHDILLSPGNYSSSGLMANTLIHAYGKCASMADAHAVFSAMPLPDVVSWTALIAGYARQGEFSVCLQLYEDMQIAGVRPNGVTFLALLSACSHAGLVDRAVEYFESMSREYGILPGIEHYATMVDLLGRAGYFTVVQDLLSQMPMQPNVAMWLCLLGACRKHGKVVMGKQAFDHAVHLQPKHSAAYILMYNIYTDAGLWDQAAELKELRQNADAWKKPGQSWIGHNHELHTFFVGDCRHPQQEQLHDLLAKVISQVMPSSG